MLARIRSLVAALTIAALFTSIAAPAFASGAFGANDDTSAYEASVPVVFDVLLLRPLGFAMMVGGAVLYAFPVFPIALATRPTQFWKPLGPLVAAPAKYTFSDPLGYHPEN